jgi:hypothetical protein
MENEPDNLYRRLPQPGTFLGSSAARKLLETFPRELVADAARRVLLRLRKEIEANALSASLLQGPAENDATLVASLQKEFGDASRDPAAVVQESR